VYKHFCIISVNTLKPSTCHNAKLSQPFKSWVWSVWTVHHWCQSVFDQKCPVPCKPGLCVYSVVLFLVWNTFANTFWCMCSLHIICWSTSRKCNLLKPLLLLCHQTVVVIIRAHYYFHSPLAGALWIITYTYRLFIASVFTVGCKLFSSYKTVQMCCCVVLLCLSIVRKGEPFKKSWFTFVWNSQSTLACGISCTHDTTCTIIVHPS